MINVQKLKSSGLLERKVPFFLIEDNCYPSEEIYNLQHKVIERTIHTIREFKTKIKKIDSCILELRIEESVKCLSESLIPINLYDFAKPELAIRKMSPEVACGAICALEKRLHKDFLGEHIFRFYLPYLIFFINSKEHLKVFLDSYDILLSNTIYQSSLQNNRVIIFHSDDFQMPAVDNNELKMFQKFFNVNWSFDDCSLQFNYRNVDTITLEKIISIPFQQFQSGGYYSYIDELRNNIVAREPVDIET